MVWLISFMTLMGVNFSLWLAIGWVRFVFEKIPKRHPKRKGRKPKTITINEVAAIIPAHNEETSIRKTIEALAKVLPKKNIYLVNDSSTDKTATVARNMRVNVITQKPNGGKAKALVYTMKRYNLYEKYKAILIHDADVMIHPDYMKYALPLLSQKDTAAVAPHQVTEIKNYGFWENFFIAYRVRLWRILQLGMRYGMTWKYTNVTYIIPGGLSVYKTKVLKKLSIDAPNLVIEDFNMTFEVRKKKLGNVAYIPAVKGYSQDPYYLKDYIKQVKRWNLGFWQTIFRNGVWPSMFWLFLGGFLIEMLLYALVVLASPLVLSLLLLNQFHVIAIQPNISLAELFVGLFLMDYLLTIFATILEKKPLMLLYGVGFFFLRYIDSLLFLFTLPLVFSERSTGSWVSPRRSIKF